MRSGLWCQHAGNKTHEAYDGEAPPLAPRPPTPGEISGCYAITVNLHVAAGTTSGARGVSDFSAITSLELLDAHRDSARTH